LLCSAKLFPSRDLYSMRSPDTSQPIQQPQPRVRPRAPPSW
jgi:hypothetical protein